MKKLFPKSEQWVHNSILLQNNNIDRTKLNEIDEIHFERTGKHLSSWNFEEYLTFLNVCLKIVE